MTIISASRRTDIPAYYASWFMNRIRAGSFLRVNPFNPRQMKEISLAPADVAAIVFWTKNPAPLISHLAELDARGYRYYFQFTLNPYDQRFEPHVPELGSRLATFCRLSDQLGPDRVVWRYDPIILSSAMPLAFHLEQSAALAAALKGHTKRLVFSFLDFYGKISGRVKELYRKHGILLNDIAAESCRAELHSLMAHFGRLGDENGMEVFSCAEEVNLAEYGIRHGACVDGELIRSLFGRGGSFARDRNQRGACCCVKSVDMGMYSTCPCQCGYCYANRSEQMTLANLGKHDPNGPALLTGCPSGRNRSITKITGRRSNRTPKKS
jgi:DNA repair photolyase